VLETYRQFPALCESLVMVLGGAGNALDSTRLPISGANIERLARSLPRRAFAAIIFALTQAFRRPGAHSLGRLSGVIGRQVSRADMQELTEHMTSLDPYTLQRLLISSQTHSARDVLATLRVPLLIIAGDVDPFAPTHLVGLALHRAVPSSRLVRLPHGTHTALLEEPQLIAHSVLQFLADA
jgi:pimeloyl-ACP methyl ester carboxylesterase